MTELNQDISDSANPELIDDRTPEHVILVVADAPREHVRLPDVHGR